MCETLPFCSETSPITSCSCEKRYQALPAYSRSEAGEPGNETKELEGGNVWDQGYKTHINMCLLKLVLCPGWDSSGLIVHGHHVEEESSGWMCITIAATYFRALPPLPSDC